MKRRSFLKYSSLLSTPILVGGIPVSSIARSQLTSMINEETDRVLVLIQLNGGNDGLATIIPRDQQDVLENLRSNIIIPESNYLPIEDTVALHPNMGGIKNLYDDAKVKVIQSVGYPNQNRSHFRSLDIWHTASDANEFLTTGWLGRYFDFQYPNYPVEYPNDDFPDPFALTIGSVVSETCQGLAGNFSMTVVDPNNLAQLGSPANNDVLEGCGSDQLAFLANAIEKTNEYSERIIEAYEKGNNEGTLYGDENRLANQLKTVARLISGGLKSKVFVVSLGGFDTHADQTDSENSTLGNHADLLLTLSDAIQAFQDDISKMGLAERIMGMTYSEFGRRIRSNFSYGTDHGDAAPLILFGNCVNPGIYGQNPEISPDTTQSEAIPMQYDFRSVYGSVLMDWFEVEESLVQSIMPHDFQYIPVAAGCNQSTAVDDYDSFDIEARIYPNPTEHNARLEFHSESGWHKVSILNAIGYEIEVIANKTLEYGTQTMTVNLANYPAGAYFVRIQTQKYQKVLRIMKG